MRTYVYTSCAHDPLSSNIDHTPSSSSGHFSRELKYTLLPEFSVAAAVASKKQRPRQWDVPVSGSKT